jgi:hypothetical protein
VIADNVHVGLVAIALLASPPAASAQQTGGRIVMQLAHAINGPSSIVNQRQSATARYEPDSLWLASGEVLLTPRWGVGVEWRKPDDVTFGRSRAVNSFSQTERERAFFTMVTFRAARGRWGAVDFVGGPGFVHQHVTLTAGSSFPTTGTTSQTSESSHTLGAVTGGADAMIQVVPHVGVGTLIRFTGTNRSSELVADPGTAFIRTYSLGLFVRAWL